MKALVISSSAGGTKGILSLTYRPDLNAAARAAESGLSDHASSGHRVDDAVVTALVLALPRLPASGSPDGQIA